MPVKPLPVGYESLVFRGVFGRERAPRMPAKCRDCAFQEAGSPEQADPQKWFGILAGVDRGDGFYCHTGIEEDEGGAYVPTVVDGVPVDYRLCAGWVEMRSRFLAVQRSDYEDEMMDIRAARPDLWLAVDLAVRASRTWHAELAAERS